MDSPLMTEARELIAFYDAQDWNWESALGFTLCRDVLGNRLNVYDPRTHVLYAKRIAKEQANG